jgi:hypothetical protein
MPEDQHTILDRIRKFEETFEQIYHRTMRAEERRILEAAKENIQQVLRAQGSGPAAD